MEWSLSRSETLHILHCMGIELPANTKLSDDILDKRLRDALSAAQYKDRLPSPFDLLTLLPWPRVGDDERDRIGRSLFEAVQRGSIHESSQIYQRKQAGGSAVPTLFVDPFIDLRQTMMGLGKFLDQGLRWCVLQDREREHCAVNVRILSVLEINDKTPAIVVLYQAFDKSTAEEGVAWVRAQVTSNPPEIGAAVINVNATPLEQRLLLKFLKLNASMVPPDYQVDRRPGEQSFKVSVLLPVGPLEHNALSKLNANAGCAMCDKRAASRCSSCQSISYCGSACQRADWPDHKHTCRSLKGGTWHTLHLRATMPGMEDKWMRTIPHRTSTSHELDDGSAFHKAEPEAVPPNVYGGQPFLVKLQLGLAPADAPSHMMVYDRRRTFQAFVTLEDDARTFAEFVQEMRGPRGGHRGVKMYRWARRSDEWGLSVCLDREPGAAETKW